MQRSTDGYVAGDPRSANIASLSAAFANIDLEEDYRKERTRMLTILDKGGDVEIDNPHEVGFIKMINPKLRCIGIKGLSI